MSVMPLPSAAGERIGIMSQLETGEERRVFRVAMALVPRESANGEGEHKQGLMYSKGATLDSP